MTGRTALVTGANRGIGLEIARGLVREGLTVLTAARSIDKAGAAAAAIGEHASPIAMDVGDAASLRTAIAALATQGVEVDVLVNNAGVLLGKNLLETSDDDTLQSIAVNALGPLHLIRVLAPGMAARGYGRIVNLSSNWGSLSDLGPGAYGVTKAFLNAITVKLAGELPETVKVNAMCPGWVHTEMGGPNAPRTPAEGADTAVFLATLPDDGPTGQMFRDRKPIDW
ncbi:MAG: SDR family NAD(P)-dependent oxidoreductase [Pseudomonadota bacterium]